MVENLRCKQEKYKRFWGITTVIFLVPWVLWVKYKWVRLKKTYLKKSL